MDSKVPIATRDSMATKVPRETKFQWQLKAHLAPNRTKCNSRCFGFNYLCIVYGLVKNHEPFPPLMVTVKPLLSAAGATATAFLLTRPV